MNNRFWFPPLRPSFSFGISYKRLLGLLALLICSQVSVPALIIQDLRCDYLKDPLGIDVPDPRLSWVLESSKTNARDEHQRAYQILVASSPRALEESAADLWNSGRVGSDQSIQIPYGGRPLVSGQQCFWKVRVWDQAGKISVWSQPSRWTMGLLKASDWHAKWIGLDEPNNEPEDRRLPARLLRREFDVAKPVRRATAYVCGLGLFEFYLNGARMGNHVLSPGLTDYTKRAFYVTFDATPQMRLGTNAVGVMLGNGRFYAPRSKIPTATVSYGFPKLLFQMRVEYADGTSSELVSDASWKLTTDGPIRANSEYDGEVYDARKEMPGWAEAGFDDSIWQTAQLVSGCDGRSAQGKAGPSNVGIGCRLAAQMIDPIRVVTNLQPVAITNPKPGVYIFDMGQNMVGWCRLKVAGPVGTEITLCHAEALKSDGTLYLDNIRSAKVTDTYILKGAGEEFYEPRFTYHGFRYVEMKGFPGKPSLAAIEGRVVHDDLRSTGDFVCSNPHLNQIYQNIRWGLRGNYRSIPTDCPQRDERQGWLGDRSAESKGETYLFDTAALYTKWLQDMVDAQKPEGSVPDVCPAYWPIYSDNVTWPSSTVIIPSALYEQFGDATVVASHYASAKKWMQYMTSFITNGIISRDTYGDWCVPPEDPKLIHSNDPARKTDKGLLATAYFYLDAKRMQGYARLLRKTEDASYFTDLAETLKRAFNTKFFNNSTGYYDNGSQTSCVLPLAFGLVPEGERERVFAHLVKSITEGTQGHIGTGLVGGQWLMRVLSDNGRPDLAYSIAAQTTYPSWGYMVEQGATTIWELWNGNTADPAMNSGNHVMLVGDLGIWLFEYVGGFRPDPEEPGFKHISLRPEAVGDLRFVRATHESPYGLISSEWSRQNQRFKWAISIPCNTTATVCVPAKNFHKVTESGKPAVKARKVSFVRMDQGHAIFTVGSGHYLFESR
jgi:alpha-L-rhamnosidase